MTECAQGVITKVEQQKRNKHRYNIYVDEQYAFAVHEDVVVACRLIKGKEIHKEELKEILLEEERKKIEHAGNHYLSYRPRTIKEMRIHLQQKGFEQKLIEGAIDGWLKRGYLDDRQFAQIWVKERLTFKNKGKSYIYEELKQKGIAREWIEQALAQIEEEAELMACLESARKKQRYLVEEDRTKGKAKLISYLIRRGFSLEMSKQVYKQLVAEINEERTF